MKLIADSGSTKTDWALVTDDGSVAFFCSQGINPIHQDDATIGRILAQELLPQLPPRAVSELFFYGSGVRPSEEQHMQAVLGTVLHAVRVEAHSDLLGAARALCGHDEGLACILGTGSNSCHYDGHRIVQNTPPLGFILGDEGSGAVLGIALLNALYKGRLSDSLRQAFESSMGMTLTQVLDRVYRQPLANRFLASLSPFIHDHLDDEHVEDLVVSHFLRFFRHNLEPYHCPHLSVNAVGSVASCYEPQFREAAAAAGFSVGRVVRSPIHRLIDYHHA